MEGRPYATQFNSLAVTVLTEQIKNVKKIKKTYMTYSTVLDKLIRLLTNWENQTVLISC